MGGHQHARGFRIGALKGEDNMSMIIRDADIALFAISVAAPQRGDQKPMSVDDGERFRISSLLVDALMKCAVGDKHGRVVAALHKSLEIAFHAQ